MLNPKQAQKNLEEVVPGVIPKAWVQYKNLYLFRIELPNKKIAYDPFFSVDINTGEVEDFSILDDLTTISNLKWNDI
jgi:hypothetical protein